jgi:endonuclease/exonuclease/phosphatase family metal-dependent hydrolase
MTFLRARSLLLFFLLISQCDASPTKVEEVPVEPAQTDPRQKDIIKVMSYNVLKYGDECQGPNATMHSYLKTIIGYAEPDILGLVKVEAIPQSEIDKGQSPIGFADSILIGALNAAKPGRYAYCPFTNAARDKDECLLFYNKHKFGFASFSTMVSDISDINMYKLYYLDLNLAKTHDTSFLYVVLLHTASGDVPDDRNRQVTELMNTIIKYFPALPNMIIMGDFNLRKTNEDGYQAIISNAEKNYRFFDPPFAIDKKVSYPANWDKHPEQYSSYLTTSTRKKWKEPNDCGTGGAAKGWYDHIFIAPKLADKNNFYHYIPSSYHTIGNDGNRLDASVNDLPNKSAPSKVLEALYQMSNKYPVMLELGVSP